MGAFSSSIFASIFEIQLLTTDSYFYCVVCLQDNDSAAAFRKQLNVLLSDV